MAGSGAGFWEAASSGVSLPLVLKEESQTMIQAYKVVIEHDARDGYVATFPEFAGRKAQAKSLKVLLVRIGETMAPYIEAGQPAATPDPVSPHRMAQA